VSLPFPEVVSLGIAQAVTSRLTALADLSWTRWKNVDEITVAFANPAQPTTSQRMQWENTFRVAVGAEYQFSDAFGIRAGTAYDQSPISTEFRTADLPENDRLTVGAGATYRPDEGIALTFSYSYDRERDARVSLTASGAGTLSGLFHRESHAVGIEASFSF
jgi:long-chain fatty acid transport protein